MSFHITILTIFPEMFPGALGQSLVKKALDKKIWSYEVIDIRNFGITKHKNVDDTVYGGGAGLIMRPDVLGEAIDYAQSKREFCGMYYMSPKGSILNNKIIEEVSIKKNIMILCGRFEGIDERIIEEYNLQEISIGDYILSGGEIAAMVFLDTCIRILPGVLGNEESLKEESFVGNLLEYPMYTKPYNWRGRKVPDVLMSGNHNEINKWRLEQSKNITKSRRTDLWNDYNQDN